MTGRSVTAETRVAVVSGGSRGLGAALARRLLAEDHRVAVLSRHASSFIEEMQGRDPHEEKFLWRSVDVERLPEIRTFAQTVSSAFGRVDLLINNATALYEGLLPMTPDEEIERLLRVNVLAPMVLTKLCTRHMIRNRTGAVLNISSINSVRGHKGVSVYSATKAAIDGFTRSMAREYGPANIRVNSIAPGFFTSDLTAYLDLERREQIIRRTPLGRISTLNEVLEMALMLCRDSASFVTGQIIVVDGGITC